MTEAGRLAKCKRSQQLVECAVIKRDMKGGMEGWAGELEEHKSVPSGSPIRFLDKQNSMILVQDVARVITGVEEFHHLLGSAIIG